MRGQRSNPYGLPISSHASADEGGVFIDLWLEVFAPDSPCRLNPLELMEAGKSPQQILDALRAEAAHQRRASDGLV